MEKYIKIKPPIILKDNVEISVKEAGFSYREQINVAGDIHEITRMIKNETNEPAKIRLLFEAETKFAPEKYLIPCVSYNGNQFGEGKEPKGLTVDGEVWMHAYERSSIPSCTISENEEIVFALFASDNSSESLESCCGMYWSGKELCHRIMWPANELPYTYSSNDVMTAPRIRELILQPGACYETTVCLFIGKPYWKNFGFAPVADAATEYFKSRIDNKRSNEELWDLGITYLKNLVKEHKGAKLISNGQKPDAEGKFFAVPLYEIGWCGQNALTCRLFFIEALKRGDQKLLSDALEICDNWVLKQEDNGLILAHYEWYKYGREWTYVPKDPNKSWASNVDWVNGWLPEVCNLGWAASEFIKIWKLLEENGIQKDSYKEFATKICDFFVEHYSEKYAFGKGWYFDGRCAEEKGTIGGFVCLALIEAYRILGKEEYLACARKAVDFYYKRDIEEFVCTAGAIDCTCIDKETSAPFIRASLDLFEITGDREYLKKARQAAYYFVSWMYVYDAEYDEDTDFTIYGYHTVGGTSVSVQHPAIDQYGELIVSDLIRLGMYTDDERWTERAKMIWHNCLQCIADESTEPIHGIKRPVGAQEEAFYHCDWGHNNNCAKGVKYGERGHMNDWLVSWVSAYRLDTIQRLSQIEKAKDTF